MNNYEKTLLRAEKEFLRYNQELIIRESNLMSDDDFLYVNFFYHVYRINRKTGYIEAFAENGCFRAADFNEGMSILDVICEPVPYRSLSGEMVTMDYFTNTSFDGSGLYTRFAEMIDSDIDVFRNVSLDLGAVPYGKSDAGFIYKLFDFLPLGLQFWEREDEIPPSLNFLWDRNSRDYIRFESMHYALIHVLNNIADKMSYDKMRR